MRRIVKRLFKRDTTGKVHVESIQELVDNEHGTISETTLTTLTTCATCSRPVEKLTEIRGCDRCGASCCDRCAIPCAVCSRHLCPQCRRGFGEKQLAACPECLSVLNERLERYDRLLEEKAAFERLLAVYREQVRIVQHGMFHNYPCGDLLEQLAELHLMKKLKSLERAITDHAERE
jgi:hypothetical protein